ncbi:MAG: lamin tail domain-containing protein [Candidatus Eisenbacteria bacterium]
MRERAWMGSGVWLSLLLAVAVMTPAFVRVEAAPCLNEIVADPNRDWNGNGEYNYRDDEWVELFNPGPGHVNLEEYALSDDAGLWTYGFEVGSVLGVGEAIAIYGHQSVLWQQTHGESQYGFKLNNDGGTVLLWQVAGGDTILVDMHTFNTHEAEDDRAAGRHPDGIGEWEIFDGLNPYGGTVPPLGNGLDPTPGLPNSGTPPPVALEDPSWGMVKQLFH